MSGLSREEILKLTVPERIQLVEDIWDTICECPEALPLTKEQEEELQRRLEAYHRDPSAVTPWSVVRERIQRRT